MAFSFFKQRSKNVSELICQVRDGLSASFNLEERLEKSPDDLSKNLQALKQLIYGEGDVEPSQEVIASAIAEVCKNNIPGCIVHALPHLEFEARKDAVQIWCLLLCQVVDGDVPVVKNVESDARLIDTLIRGYEDPEVALSCGTMLRECCRHLSLNNLALQSPSFEHFFDYVETTSFELASDAFQTLKELLSRHKDLVSTYLIEQYDHFFHKYNSLLQSRSYLTRRQSLKLLGELLLDRANVTVMLRYIADPQHLRLLMLLLRDESRSIQYEAFHVFKVFVANPKKPPAILKILSRNRERLLNFLHNFQHEKGDEQFDEEKELLCKEIEALPTFDARTTVRPSSAGDSYLHT